MKNIICLQKQDDGSIMCKEISEEGISYMEEVCEKKKLGETIIKHWNDKIEIKDVSEIEKLLDKDIN